MPAERITVSPTQLSAADSCLRKWWFTWGKKLPGIEKDYFTFGTVLHGVIERFMSADELGRDRATGNPIDLYPPGWDSTPKRGGGVNTVSIMEADLIRRMMDKAISTGIIVRDPNALIEFEARGTLCIVKNDDGSETQVDLFGIIDWMDDTGMAPGTLGHKEVLFYVNAFSQGDILGKNEIDEFLRKLNIPAEEQFFLPCTNAEIIRRQLNNLKNSYEKLNDPDRVADIQHLLSLFQD